MEIIERKPNPQRRLDEFGDGIPIIPFDWKAYNNSQMSEKKLFFRLLSELSSILDGDSYIGKGRKPMPSSHMIFCMCTKVYSATGSRRIISDLEMCKDKGYLKSTPQCSSIWNYFNSRALTKKLKYLIRLSALPLGQLEKTFAVDSSGIAERRFLPRWSTVRQKYEQHHSYKKIHCIYGTFSNIIADVIVTDGKKGDSPYFKELLKETAKRFDIKMITADMAYSSRENLKIADELGISPFIPFKKNAKGTSKGAPIWNKMYKFFNENPEEFYKNYHQRSNAESGFFMIWQRFKNYVYSKNEIAQINEILCKILCHNICVLIQEMFLSKVEIDFYSCAKRYNAQ